MNLINTRIFLIFLILSIVSCGNRKKDIDSEAQAEPFDIKYAQGFTVDIAKDYIIVKVLNPWRKGEAFQTYYLVKNMKIATPKDGKKIKIPVNSLVVNSATYLEFLELLQEIDKVTGVCNAKYIYNPNILEGVKEGKIKDIGDSFNLDIENILLLHPEAIMTPAYNAEDENSRKLEQTGLAILYNIEWQEKTPLGRAEWIKFIGAFFDKLPESDSIFNNIDENYNKIATDVLALSYSPSVMSGQDFRGTWSMPGGNSFNARLFRDAGANYYYANDSTSGSIPTNIENVLLNFNNADFWVGAQVNTLEELGTIDSKYKLFRAFKDGNVYNYNGRINQNHGNDYWESAVARPDILLLDMVKVFHPGLLPDYELFYMKKLE